MRRTIVRHRGSEIPRHAHAVLVFIVGVVVAAGPTQISPDRHAPRQSRLQSPVDGCPAMAAKASGAPMAVVVDYVDFVVVGRTTYIAGLEQLPRVDKTELDKVVMTSRCSFSELNHRTGQMTPTPGNGHTAYLPPGTPVYAIRGWSPACRLAAEHDGELHVYLAQQDGATESRPATCAVS